ncbi:MAG: amino acid ABC transporter substrate-binding protein [Rhodospirillales bacterium]
MTAIGRWTARSAVLAGAVAAFAFGGTAQAQGSGSATLDASVKRGHMLCAVSGQVPGFSLADSQGVMRGLDADTCRAIAAAALGDASKAKFVATTTQNRFTALQSGEVDVLSRSTTWTLSREGNLGLMFAWVNYYDGTGFLVKKSSGVKAAKEMDGASICVQPGSSTELAIQDYYRLNNMKFTPILIQDLSEIQAAFLSGRCDAYSTDASALATFRFSQGPKAEELMLLPDIISKEPLGAMVRKGDDKWFDIVRWTFAAMIVAEEKGITQANIDTFMDSKDPDIRRLLGLEGDMGKALGVDPKFAYNVIKAVGNLGEMWDRNITPMGVPRGINNLWTKGGLQYAPPMR